MCDAVSLGGCNSGEDYERSTDLPSQQDVLAPLWQQVVVHNYIVCPGYPGRV